MFYLLFAFAILTRFLPHPPNVAAIGALGLFAGCYLNRRWSVIVPVAALFASDLIGQWLKIPGMGFYSPLSMVFVYSGFLAAAVLGRSLRHRVTAAGVVGYSFAGSTVFFLISNFGVWLSGNFHSHPTSLVQCYFVALPFYGATVAGDLIYATLLFGGMALAARNAQGTFPTLPGERELTPVRVRR